MNRVKRNAAKGMAKDDAIKDALDRAIRGNLLGGFFKMQKAEVLNMSLTEFDQEEYDRNRRMEGIAIGEEQGRAVGIAIGIAEGEERKAIDAARNLKQLGVSQEIIAQATGVSLEEVAAL